MAGRGSRTSGWTTARPCGGRRSGSRAGARKVPSAGLELSAGLGASGCASPAAASAPPTCASACCGVLPRGASSRRSPTSRPSPAERSPARPLPRTSWLSSSGEYDWGRSGVSVADVNRSDIEAIRRTIIQFEINANYPLRPCKCFTNLQCIWVQRVLAISVFFMFCFFIVAVYPLLFGALLTLPVASYFHVFYSGALRAQICSPPFSCSDADCDDAFVSPASWPFLPLDVSIDEERSLYVVVGIVVLSMIGIHISEALSLFREGSLSGGKSWQRSLKHFVRGFDSMMKRVLALMVLRKAVMTTILFSQMVNYGEVGQIAQVALGQMGQKLKPPPEVPQGWSLDFDLGNFSFLTGLDKMELRGGVNVIKFDSWYTCANYTMSRWQANNMLKVKNRSTLEISDHPGTPDVGVHRLDDTCGDCNFVPLTAVFNLSLDDGSPHEQPACCPGGHRYFWHDLAYGAYYWGNAGRIGEAWSGEGPLNSSRANFYSAWFQSCRSQYEAMCFIPPQTVGGSYITGCCSADFTLLLVGVGISLLMVGCFLARWRIVFGPAVAVYFIGSIVQWRTLGPLTASPSAAGEGQTLVARVLPFTHVSGEVLFGILMVLTIALFPFLGYIRRVSNKYYRSCLVNSYYHGGKDVLLSECAEVPLCPNLLFGSTLLLHRSEYDQKSSFGTFCISSRLIGGPRTRYVKTPAELSLAQAMACSAAAVDAAALTNFDSWTSRFWMSIFNFSQGDWLRVHSQRPGSRCSRTKDALPFAIAFTTVLILVTTTDVAQTRGFCDLGFTCMIVAVCLGSMCFAATFFMPLSSWLVRTLQPSPLVRMLQMVCVLTPVMDKEPPPYMYLGDGGLLENSGCLELLFRQVPLIIVMEAGDDPEMQMSVFKKLLARVQTERICSFFVEENPRQSVWEAIDAYQRDSSRTFFSVGILYTAATPRGRPRPQGPGGPGASSGSRTARAGRGAQASHQRGPG
ncbi:unnamed protein product [Prorocentrum cordatum]|uniref:Chitin synthase n=1 Tax=Prorocentrum cordatum TaxID=2364126 RepID=A0ABN9XTL3_9DINO|nr:unnamed protein product [Polarella glacialis]